MAKTTFQNLPDEKRATIVEAALEEFAARPYEKASLSAIVRSAGIAKGSMYQYFENKLALFRWLVFEHVAQAKAEYADHAAIGAAMADGELLAFLRSGIRSGIEFTLERPRLARVGLRLMEPTSDADLRATFAEHIATGEAVLTQMVERAQERNTLNRELDPALTAMLITQITGTTVVHALMRTMNTTLDAFLNEPDSFSRPSVADIDALVDGLMTILERGLEPRAEGV